MKIRSENCKLYKLLEIIGKKRVVFIIYLLSQGYDSFSMIHKAIPLMSGRISSDRLKTLQKNGLVEKNVTSVTPLRIRYKLSKLGYEVAQHINDMRLLVGSEGIKNPHQE